MNRRNRYNAEFKGKVALTPLSDSRTLAELASEYSYPGSSCSRFGRVELSISSHPAQAGLFSTRPGENPA